MYMFILCRNLKIVYDQSHLCMFIFRRKRRREKRKIRRGRRRRRRRIRRRGEEVEEK